LETSLPAEAGHGLGSRHLVHRPRYSGPRLPDGSDDLTQEFVLTGELPARHPLFNDGPDHCHEFQAAMAMIRQVSGGIGQAHFGVGADRVPVFYRFGVTTDDVSAWRRHTGPGTLTATLRVRPDKVIGGIPRALDFEADLEIDGAAAGTGSASLLLLAPLAHRSQRENSRISAPAAAADRSAEQDRTAPRTPAPEPGEVGRTTAANVLLRSPVTVGGHRLSAAVQPPARWPQRFTRQDGTVSSVLLLEVLRQTALLTVHRLHGLDPRHCAPVALHTHFRGHARPDLPLRCVAVTQPVGQDAQGRPLVSLTLALSQAGQAVTEAVVSFVEDL
jgi:2-oxo-3-(phosphooxy)propyl 3-oxoalkanoate synthase